MSGYQQSAAKLLQLVELLTDLEWPDDECDLHLVICMFRWQLKMHLRKIISLLFWTPINLVLE